LMAECDGLDKHKIAVDPSVLHQRVVNVLGIYEDRGGGLRLSVGPIEEGLRHVFGPVKDRQRAQDFVDDLAVTLGEKLTRNGMLLTSVNCSLVMASLSGSLPDLLREVEKNLWSLRIMFWRKNSLTNQRARLQKIQNLLNMASTGFSPWRDLSKLHGAIIVPDDGTSTWVLHTVVGGVPKSTHQIRGDWRQKIAQGGFGKRIINRIYKDIRAPKGPELMSKFDLGRLNAVVWWINHGVTKDGGAFVELEELESMLRTQKAASSTTESEE
jgi:hypothetical protein